MQLKRIVITGATGFIGRHCLPLLAENAYEIHAFRFGSQPVLEKSNVIWHKVDLLHRNRISEIFDKIRPSHLLHLAWYLEPGKWANSPQNYRWVQASLDLLLAFEKVGGQRAVMAGSCAEYDWRYSYCVENLTPLRPNTVYGACKTALHEMFGKITETMKFNGAWGRPFFIYGPYEHPSRLVSSVILSLLENLTAQCTHGNQIRDFLYVKDVADALIALLESNVVGPVNIASGCPVALKEIIVKIADRLNGRELLQLGAIDTPDYDPSFLIGDITRLTKEVSWQPKYSLDQGLEETINWWEHNRSVNMMR